MYTPDSDGRTKRDSLRQWFRQLRLTEWVLLGAGVVWGLDRAGFHYLPTSQAMAAETMARAKADTIMSIRIDHTVARIDSLSDRMLFLSYLQCVQATGRLDAKAQDECRLIIQRRLSP